MPTPQLKDEKTYQALQREGNSEKSVRTANAAAASSRKESRRTAADRAGSRSSATATLPGGRAQAAG